MKNKKEIFKKSRAVKKPLANDKKYYYAIFIIALITLLIYLPVIHNGFVWDDNDYILNNPLIKSFNLKDFFSEYVMGNYHPLTILTYAGEFLVFKFSESGYHIINLIIHIINTILAFKVVSLLSEKKEVALIASLLFGIHPIHVESVAWVSELKDLQYTLFFILSWIYYMKYLKDDNKNYYFISIILFMLSILSKAMAVSLPFVLILTDYFKGYKINFKTLTNKIPYFIPAIIFGMIAIDAQEDLGAIDATIFPFYQRIVFASYGFITYLIKLILPVNLCAYYPYPLRNVNGIPSQFYLFLLIAPAVIAFAFYSLRYSKKIFFTLIFFLITILLVLQLLPVGGAIMADRYCYIPSIGFFYLAGEGFYWLRNARNKKVISSVILGIFVISFSVKTHSQCEVWKNGMTLWNDVIKKFKTIPQAYVNRGILLVNEKRYDEALNDYNKAIELDPNLSNSFSNRGILLRTLMKYEDAQNDFDKAIQLNQKNPTIYLNRGLLLNYIKKYEEAVKDFDRAIELNPGYAEAYSFRGVVYRNLNKNDESLNDFNKAIELQPGYYKAYSERAVLMANQNKYDLAINDYNKAINLQPDYALAYMNRGILLQNMNKYNKAFFDYDQASKLQPDNPKIYYNRANLFAIQKKYDDAINDFSIAINLKNDYALAYLGRGLAECNSEKREQGCSDLQYASRLGSQAATDALNIFCK